MNGRTAVLTTSVCALLLFACSGKIDPSATGNGPGGASSRGTSGAGATGDTANGSDGDFVSGGPSTGTDPGGPSSGVGSTGSAPCFTTDVGPECSKVTAGEICKSKGYALTGLSSTSSGTCLATCCPSKTPPPPPPSTTACTYEQVGDGSTCLSYANIKARAVSQCDLHKMTVRSLYPANDCPGGATIAKLECCATK